MEPKFQSSFIPKGPIGVPGAAPVGRTQHKSFFSVLAALIFAISAAGAVGAFAFRFYLNKQIGDMGLQIDQAKNDLSFETIKEMTDLNDRITLTRDLINKHSIVSPILAFLESNTLKTVRFRSFRYAMQEGKLKLSMEGQAKGYAALALQADIFNQSKYVKNSLFTDLALDDDGNVVFSFSADVDPSLVSYQKGFEKLPASSVSIPPVITATTTAQAATSTTATSTSKATSTATTTKK